MQYENIAMTTLPMKALITLNEEISDTMKIVKSLKESGLLTKSISKTIQNEAKEKKMISWYVTRYIGC